MGTTYTPILILEYKWEILHNDKEEWYAVLTKRSKRLLFIAYWDKCVIETINFYTNYEDRKYTKSNARGIILLQCTANARRT